MRSDSRDAEVEVFGYFPSLRDDPEAVQVTIDNLPVKINRSVGKLFFDLPSSVLASKKQTADISIKLPKKHWYSKRPTPVAVRIHILKAKPYSFDVGVAVDNPAAIQTVKGGPHQDATNNNSSPHYDAITMFNLTVPDTQKYEPSTAKFVNVETVGLTGGKAFGRGNDTGAPSRYLDHVHVEREPASKPTIEVSVEIPWLMSPVVVIPFALLLRASGVLLQTQKPLEAIPAFECSVTAAILHSFPPARHIF
jgi:hypothetical protein